MRFGWVKGAVAHLSYFTLKILRLQVRVRLVVYSVTTLN